MASGPEGSETPWARWLRAELGDRKQVWLVRRSGGEVAAPQLSRWLRQGERPEPDKVVLVADLFGASRREALTVAGYTKLAESFDDTPITPPDPVDPLDAEIEAMDLSKRAKRMIRERREQNLRELRELIKILRETEAEKGNAPDTAPVNSDDR